MRRQLKVLTLRSAVLQFAIFTIIQGTGIAQQTLTWTQMCSPPGPHPGYFAAMAYDSIRDQVVLFGGATLTTNVELNQTWIWNGTRWIHRFPANPPPARAAHAMAFDAARGEVVLFGGAVGSAIYGDTWVWDGSTWTNKSPKPPAMNPPARLHAGMVFDTALQRVLLIGGSNGSPAGLADTWAWDGTNWTPLASLPVGRGLFGVAYDTVRHQTVVYGGTNNGQFVGDTLTFDGTSWTDIPGGPTPLRELDRMVFDSELGETVLFGGSGATGEPLYGDTWIWNGTSWAPASLGSNPPPSARTSHTMAYDIAHSQVVLFGGYTAPPTSLQAFPADTWVYGAPTVGGCSQTGTLGIDISSIADDAPDWNAIKGFTTTIGGNVVHPQFVIVDAYGGAQQGMKHAHEQIKGALGATLGVAAYCLLNFEYPDGADEEWTGGWQVNQAIAAIDDNGKDPLSQNLEFMAIDVERNDTFNIDLCKTLAGGSQANCVTRIQEALTAMRMWWMTAAQCKAMEASH